MTKSKVADWSELTVWSGHGTHFCTTGLRLAVYLYPLLWMVDHTSGFYARTKLYCFVLEAHGYERLAQLVM